jgi:hypothetical protein
MVGRVLTEDSRQRGTGAASSTRNRITMSSCSLGFKDLMETLKIEGNNNKEI